ncbi:tRNA (adenosine(37)-N6)-dimethylallyltransferase MiaA [Leadbettera azotonutricia]|uniref:tRNA dimethylallyltransferase n=1 Tax=Leadbettera azotonutricia (strain ATCC BAA-888 / DSM 13862 / ZAS-9) TaxID=545695 RepID=F5YEY6_LEAAZ|nr:tRNA (adenosine(37)-N6)-dimethylallyltransferase MiaA [Leadbettera azotonutricia]AEF82715.1 tRNA isopentenyltransferase [Leadbettera azotonutricia ZAS-9]
MPAFPVPPKKALILFGPTASGKTSIIGELFIKDRICPAEIISADSMQVYRGMDIGTAKPSPEEQSRLPHHLIDIRDPKEQFNAGEFVRLASEAIQGAANRGALPVVSGGAGFYLKNLIMGLPESPPSDAAIRLALRGELKEKGARALMDELAASDPISAARIHINDEYRLLRALEVFRLTGKPLSSYSPGSRPEGGEKQPPSQFLILGLKREREDLYRRINARCSAMFKAGLPTEAQRLFDAGYTPADPGLKAIGYKEFFIDEPDGAYRISRDIPGVEAFVAQNSRHYAKRQITFFASIPGVRWIDIGVGENQAADAIKRELEGFFNQ